MKNTQAVDDFVLKLVPLSMRGKEVHKMFMAMGASSLTAAEYESVAITESMVNSRRTGVTVSFKNEKCVQQTTLEKP